MKKHLMNIKDYLMYKLDTLNILYVVSSVIAIHH